MKSFRWLGLGLILSLAAPIASRGETTAPNPMHPLFTVLDARGAKVSESGRPASSAKTCVACHDTSYIRGHDSHAALGAKVDCLACHLSGGSLPVKRAAYDEQGRLKRAWVSLGKPTAQQCASCHVVSEIAGHPLTLPENFLLDSGPLALGVTRLQGTIWSGQLMSHSEINIEAKDSLVRPWDIHAARGLSCSDCHAPISRENASTLNGGKTGNLWHDPRQRSTAQTLHQPDHRLRTADCMACHTVEKAHVALPYAQRHLDKVACQSCHVPSVHAPLLKEDDRSVLTSDGHSRQRWHGVEADANANVSYIHTQTPSLLPYPSEHGSPMIRPVNMVLERFWVDTQTGKELAPELLARAWKAKPLSTTASSDWQMPDGSLSPLGQNALATELRRLHGASPVLQAQVRVVPISHGVQGGSAVLRRCLDCHGAQSRLANDLSVEGRGLPAQVGLVDAKGRSYPTALANLKNEATGLVVARSKQDALDLPGQGRNTRSTLLGFAFFVMTLLGVTGHAVGRWIAQRRRGPGHLAATRQVYLYPVYERLWHWVMALSTLLLVLTGFEVHFTAGFHLFGFASAVKAHNALAVVLVVNAFLSLFYHLATAHILQFFPRRETLQQDVLAQVRYYLQGIFQGAPHPSPKGLGNKLNVLQQLTYMALLNVMLPFQVITGTLMWAAGHWPQWGASLAVLTPLHNLGSWLFLSFTVGHVYLTTTGHTLTSNLKAMVDGYDQIELGENDLHVAKEKKP